MKREGASISGPGPKAPRPLAKAATKDRKLVSLSRFVCKLGSHNHNKGSFQHHLLPSILLSLNSSGTSTLPEDVLRRIPKHIVFPQLGGVAGIVRSPVPDRAPYPRPAAKPYAGGAL